MNKEKLLKIEKIIQLYKNGQMIILTDNEDRENEGDLVVSSQCITHEGVNFMAKYGRGLICIAIESDMAETMGLALMNSENDSQFSTAFTISVDARDGTTTGISAGDRLKTIKTIIDQNSKPGDLLRPGHMFPLIAAKGGLSEREGHTEASVELGKLSGHTASGVICEIMSEDGTMARGKTLIDFADKHELPILSISELKEYLEYKRLDAGTSIPTRYGDFNLYHFPSTISEQMPHIALVHKEMNPEEPVTLRIHSECMTGDLFGSLRCDCGEQLEQSMKVLNTCAGVLLYLRHEGRGIGLPKKMEAYRLQDQGFDTVEANLKLGFAGDQRDYRIASRILKLFGIDRVKLLTNNPDKVEGLKVNGIDVTERMALETKPNEHNWQYLKTKKEKMNHILKMEVCR